MGLAAAAEAVGVWLAAAVEALLRRTALWCRTLRRSRLHLRGGQGALLGHLKPSLKPLKPCGRKCAQQTAPAAHHISCAPKVRLKSVAVAVGREEGKREGREGDEIQVHIAKL